MSTTYIDPDKVNKNQAFSFDDLILALNYIHKDLQDIQSTIYAQNELLEDYIHPFKETSDEFGGVGLEKEN